MNTNFKLNVISVQNFKGLHEDYEIMLEYEKQNMIFTDINVIMYPKINISGMTVNHYQVNTKTDPFSVLDLTLIAELLLDVYQVVIGSNMQREEAQRYIEEKTKRIFSWK